MKNLVYSLGLTAITASSLTLAPQAQAALLGAGRADFSSLPKGFVVYTKNILDFTSAGLSGAGIPIVSPGVDGEAQASGSGSLLSISSPIKVVDQFAPFDIVGGVTYGPTPGQDLYKFSLAGYGDAVYKFTTVTRTPVADSGSFTFTFDGFIRDLDASDGTFDDTPSSFSVLTAQVPNTTPISSLSGIADLPTIASLDSDSNGVVDPGIKFGFSSWSATVIIPDKVPEPMTGFLTAITFGAGAFLSRRRRKTNAV